MKWIKQPFAGKPWGKRGYVELDNGTRVNVSKEDDTIAPIEDRAGNIIIWNKIRTLTLENGDEVYGCVDCWYCAPKVTSVFPHRNAHRVPKDKAAEEMTTPATVAEPPKLSRRAPRVSRAASDAQPQNDATPAMTGISDAMDAIRLLMAQAESVPALERQVAELRTRAETAEDELTEYRRLAQKLLGS